MALHLEYPDKYRLWDELVKANTDRVFVETDEPVRLGERVPVELKVEGVSLVALGDVVGLRKPGPRFRGGVWVRFDDEEVDKVRRFLGLTQQPDRQPIGRRHPRQPCALKAVFRRPELLDEVVVRNLSETGALLETQAGVKPGDMVEIDLYLESGAVRIRSELTREGPEGRYVGLRFLELTETLLALIKAEMARLAARPSSQRPTVLVADDDPAILEFLHKALSKFGYEVLKAKSGNEALSIIREVRPRLVLLDILMPGIDGVDICKVMRADVEMAGIPVIFMSALEASRLHSVADTAGATDYLPKPTTLTELLNLVGTHLKSQ
ncbi:MAG: response regulator [Archangiaceae bacterium]|nr:response regulator [Archangiaceae bacterium]